MGHPNNSLRRAQPGTTIVACLVLLACGCKGLEPVHTAKIPEMAPFCPRLAAAPDVMPRELSKVAMPDYIIEPPDVLLIEAVKVVPLPPYRINTLDVLALQVAGTPCPTGRSSAVRGRTGRHDRISVRPTARSRSSA